MFVIRHSPFVILRSVQRSMFNVGRSTFAFFVSFCILHSAFCISKAATVTGNLTDISLSPLNTKLLFSPTNEVLLSAAGLSAGPPRAIDTSAGAFSIALDAGDYTVSLPLIPWRHPFSISVFETNGSINITNLLSVPRTYLYTNRFIPPLHVNTNRVTAWSTNGQTSLLTTAATISAGTLAVGNVITIEAFGLIADPVVSVPSVNFMLKLGSTTIVAQSQNVVTAAWHLRAQITVRSAGTSGSVVGTLFILTDNSAILPFPADSQSAIVNSTGSLTVDLRASIDNITAAEAIHCDQLVIRLE